MQKIQNKEQYDVLNTFYKNNWYAYERTFSSISKKVHLEFMKMSETNEYITEYYSGFGTQDGFEIPEDKRRKVLEELIRYEEMGDSSSDQSSII